MKKEVGVDIDGDGKPDLSLDLKTIILIVGGLISITMTYTTLTEQIQLNKAGIEEAKKLPPQTSHDLIDQSVSLNLAFPSVATPKWINKVHFEAWKKGIKTLYYTRTESVLRGDIAEQAMDDGCLSCDG